MESPTRVKFSFTVDLDEVPERISSLIKQAGDTLAAESSDLHEGAASLLDGGNLAQVLLSVNQARIALMGADLRLEDCQLLLASYQSTQAELSLEQLQKGGEDNPE